MKKNILKIICVISAVVVCLYIFQNCLSDKSIVLKSSVQNFLDLQGYDNFYLLKFGKISEVEQKEVFLEVSEDEINSYIKLVLSENYYRKEITNRNWINTDDLAISDYKIMDGEKEISSVENARIRVGTGYYDVFLENAILGLEIKKEHIINWDVPDDFQNAEWAGKKFDIHLIVNELYEVTIPSVEEYAKKNGFNTTEEYRENVKNTLLENKRETLLRQNIEFIIDEMIEKSKFKINDEAVVDNAIQYYYNYKNMADICNVSVEEYITNSANTNVDIYDKCYEDSLREIQRYMIIGRYAEENQIMISVADKEHYCEEKGISQKDLTKEELIHIEYNITEEKVLQHIGQKYIKIIST